MIKYVLRRIGLAALTLWGIATIVFFMSRLIPGDIAVVAAGRLASEQRVDEIRIQLGLDQPLVTQYFTYLSKLAAGDLGTSAYTHQPVSHEIGQVLPGTVQLVLCVMVIIALVGIPLGILASRQDGKASDLALRLIIVLQGSIPVFWLAIVLRWLLGSVFGWFPLSGASTIGMAPPDVTGFTIVDSFLFADAAVFADSLWHMVLPAIALAGPFLSTIARNVRSNMIGAYKADHMVFAVSKGVRPSRLLFRHGFKTVLGSTLTILGMQIGWLMSAAVLVEVVFSMQGLGSLLVQSIPNKDTFVVLGCVLVVGAVFVVASAIVEFAQIVLDPRVRIAEIKP
ncbi:ABC transporter permease [Paenarthrobacter sp. NPDC057981]|uniref:ABC transporter permease n=1 Tax=Paenarthrobacter sp. NPDC057981 TaxID=3346297 RepID=UPI0036DF2B0D